MIRTGITSAQLVYIAFAIYANYQFFKWIFGTVKAVAFSDFTNSLIRRLTPRSVIQKRIRLEKLRRIEDQRQKEKDHQDALETHRMYQYTGWWNIGFIEEDRATLFKGYEDIKWQWGSQRIDRTKLYTPDDSIKLAYMVFLEISIYRQAFIEKAKWTPVMEVFWRKILPKQFNLGNRTPETGITEQMKQAIADFESDKPVKASA